MSPRRWLVVALLVLVSACHKEAERPAARNGGIELEPYSGGMDRLEGTQTCVNQEREVLVDTGDTAGDVGALEEPAPVVHTGGEPEAVPLHLLPFGQGFAFFAP